MTKRQLRSRVGQTRLFGGKSVSEAAGLKRLISAQTLESTLDDGEA